MAPGVTPGPQACLAVKLPVRAQVPSACGAGGPRGDAEPAPPEPSMALCKALLLSRSCNSFCKRDLNF